MEKNIEQNDDLFSEVEPLVFRLGHLNNKSSVLRPKSQNLTGQYLALQQLAAHQKMILRAKGVVDTSAPQSLQSYISVTNRQKKKLWHQSSNPSKFSDYNQECKCRSPVFNSKIQVPLSEEEDNVSLNASSVSRAVQTGNPFPVISSKVSDKISWYLEALSQGELLISPFMYTGNSKTDSPTSNPLNSTHPKQKRTINGDILDTHVNCFVKPKKPFSPRILFNPSAKSKVKEMRNYNGPFIKKKSGSNTPDTFESYEEDEEEAEVELTTNGFNVFSEDVETEISKKIPHRNKMQSTSRTRVQEYLAHHSKDDDKYHHSLNRNEEDKYLDFLSKVTEDILRSGVYSDRAIQQAFEFHMQFYEDDEQKDKLHSLLTQVLEGLKISSEDFEEENQEPLISFNQQYTPPEKATLSSSDFASDFPKSDKTTEESDHFRTQTKDLSNKDYVQEETNQFSFPES